MSVRRPKPRFKAELPLRVSPVEPFMLGVQGAVELLRPANEEHRLHLQSQLALIARDYADSKRREAQKANSSEVRVTLERLADDAAALQTLVRGLPIETRKLMGRGVRENLPMAYACLGQDLAATVDGFDSSDELTERAELLAAKFWGLPTQAEWMLVELQQYAPFAMLGENDDAELAAAFCKRMSDLALIASEVMKTERGPKSDVAQMIAVQRLKDVFEGEGLSVTHNAKVGRHYKGTLESPFGKFVKIVLGGLNSRNDMGLGDAVSFVCWPSRVHRKAPKVVEQQKARSQLITRLLETRGVAIFSPLETKPGL